MRPSENGVARMLDRGVSVGDIKMQKDRDYLCDDDSPRSSHFGTFSVGGGSRSVTVRGVLRSSRALECIRYLRNTNSGALER